MTRTGLLHEGELRVASAKRPCLPMFAGCKSGACVKPCTYAQAGVEEWPMAHKTDKEAVRGETTHVRFSHLSLFNPVCGSASSYVPVSDPGFGAENKVERTKDNMGYSEPQNEPGPIHRKKTIPNRRYQSAQSDYDPISRSHLFHLLTDGVLVMAYTYTTPYSRTVCALRQLPSSIFLTVRRKINGAQARKRIGNFSGWRRRAPLYWLFSPGLSR